jgi:hypothetical protein
MTGMIEGAIQVVPLVISILAGLTFFVVVMIFSFRSRDRLRSELLLERQTRPPGTIGPSQTKARRTMVISLVSAPIILILLIVALISTNDHRGVPAWDSWLLAILFWGMLATLLVRTVQNKRRRNRVP